MNNSTNAIRVLGIDPGSQRTGWGVVEEQSGVLHLVDCGTIHAIKTGGVFCDRLAYIFYELHAIIANLRPQEAAIEQVFVAKNAVSALKLGQARGVAVAACAAHNVPVSDYEPTLVKKSLVGTGRAEKSQVTYMAARLLGVEADWGPDAGDALGIAICHLTMRRFAQLAQKTGK